MLVNVGKFTGLVSSVSHLHVSAYGSKDWRRREKPLNGTCFVCILLVELDLQGDLVL